MSLLEWVLESLPSKYLITIFLLFFAKSLINMVDLFALLSSTVDVAF